MLVPTGFNVVNEVPDPVIVVDRLLMLIVPVDITVPPLPSIFMLKVPNEIMALPTDSPIIYAPSGTTILAVSVIVPSRTNKVFLPAVNAADSVV